MITCQCCGTQLMHADDPCPRCLPNYGKETNKPSPVRCDYLDGHMEGPCDNPPAFVCNGKGYCSQHWELMRSREIKSPDSVAKMTPSSQWISENDGHTLFVRKTESHTLVKDIQLDAFKAGMAMAVKIASLGPLNPGVKRTLEDEQCRTLVQAYQKGQRDALGDFRNEILKFKCESVL